MVIAAGRGYGERAAMLKVSESKEFGYATPLFGSIPDLVIDKYYLCYVITEDYVEKLADRLTLM